MVSIPVANLWLSGRTIQTRKRKTESLFSKMAKSRKNRVAAASSGRREEQWVKEDKEEEEEVEEW